MTDKTPAQPIPTTIITGFLGVGKTTAILHCLQQKPATEKWAVLVNEFGEIGIDGALLQDQGAFIREVPGGCMCCTAGLPMKMALNMLIARAKPDRLLIEPTGLGHPFEVLETLSDPFYRDILDLRATITLVDPRKLSQPRYTENNTFQQQVLAADILVASKTDLCADEEIERFTHWASQFDPAKSGIECISQGELPLPLLNIPRSTALKAQQPIPELNNADAQSDAHSHQHSDIPVADQLGIPDGEALLRRENHGQGFVSCGWLFNADTVFRFNDLFSCFIGVMALRIKGVMKTEKGTFSFNAENAVLSVNELQEAQDSRVEIINENALDWDAIETTLLAAMLPA